MPSSPGPRHPGRRVRAELDRSGLTITEAARRLGVSRRTLSELVNEHRAVSPEMAVRLGRFFATGTGYWMDLQARCDLAGVERDPSARSVAERIAPWGEAAVTRAPREAPALDAPHRDPVVEAYKRDVDRASIRQNLLRSPQERVRNLQALQRFADELRRAGRSIE